MPLSFSDNAISAKIRSMYAKRLTEEQYFALSRKKTVAEAAAYLRDETSYSELLYGVQPGSIHRGQLENLLKKSRFNDYFSLMKYRGSGEGYYDYVIREVETEQLLRMIRLLNSGRPEAYIADYPSFIERCASFSFSSLAKVRSFDELILFLDGTPYANILLKCRPVGSSLIDYTRCEALLESYFYTELNKLINKNYGKKTREQLHDIFDTFVELSNINNILRLKRYFPNTSPGQIGAYMLPVDGRIPRVFWQELFGARDAGEVIERLESSGYSKYMGRDDSVFVEYDTGRINYNICRHYLRYSTKAEVVFSSYMVLKRLELSNITVIIEGIRYLVPADEISKMLVN